VGDGTHHAAWKLPVVVGAIFHLVAFPVDFFFSRSSISQKNVVAKRLDPFDVRKISESQNYAETRILALHS
jgi:hypothetical protein